MSSDTPQSEENEVMGSEFCSGYMDAMGKWNNGFYCPSQTTKEQFCCGTATYKYCCPHREPVVQQDYSSLPLILGVILGVVAAITLVILVSCCFCSCCILYKKRQPRLNGGPLYRMHCSSTASGVANMYSFSNPNSLATTPLDSAVASSRLLVDLEPVVAHSMPSTDSRATMGRVHTFSRETRSTGMDVHIGELGEVTSGSPEPPPPYDSSSRDEQHRDTTVQVLSHGSCFNASITLRPTPCAVPQTPTSGTMPMEPQSARVFPSAASSDLIPGSRIGTTFNPEPISTPLATTEPISIGSSVPAPQTPSSSGLLQGPSTSSIASVGPGGHDALYHSTKF